MEEIFEERCEYAMHWHQGTREEIKEQKEECREEVRRIFGD